MKKYKYIDSLRGYAILGVLLVHCSQYGTNKLPSLITNLLNEGARGVQLFFVASALTLFLSFKARKESEEHAVSNFFIRRFFRIAPLFYLAIFYYLFQNWHSGRNIFVQTGSTVIEVLANFLFLNGFNPNWIDSIVPGGWSIAVEMSFYLLVPFLFQKLTTAGKAFDFLLLTLLLRFLLELFFERYQLPADYYTWKNYLFLYLPSQLPVFALGIILYHAVNNSQQASLSFKPVSLLLFALMIFIQVGTKRFEFLPNHIFISIGFCFFAYSLSLKQPVLLVNKLICFIGKVSYSMYIIHFAVLYWLSEIGFIDFAENPYLNFGIRFLLVAAVSIFISNLSYKYYEMVFQNIGSKLISRLEKIKVS